MTEHDPHGEHRHGDQREDHAHGGHEGHELDFDARAATWDDDPEKVERARVVAELVRRVTGLSGSTRVLEYGAGTALLGQALVPHIGPLTVADPSVGMREVLAQKVSSGVLPDGTRIWDVDLATGPVPAESFDLIVSLLALHHIPDVPAVLRGFAALLPPGGQVSLADLVAEDGSFHDSPNFDGHDGFELEELTAMLHDAGFENVDLRHAYDVEKQERSYPLFLATARRRAG